MQRRWLGLLCRLCLSLQQRSLRCLPSQLRCPGVLLQAVPAWVGTTAVLKPGQFDPFGPDFCTEGSVQLLLGEWVVHEEARCPMCGWAAGAYRYRH